jgi:hypothetical protein
MCFLEKNVYDIFFSGVSFSQPNIRKSNGVVWSFWKIFINVAATKKFEKVIANSDERDGVGRIPKSTYKTFVKI